MISGEGRSLWGSECDELGGSVRNGICTTAAGIGEGALGDVEGIPKLGKGKCGFGKVAFELTGFRVGMTMFGGADWLPGGGSELLC